MACMAQPIAGSWRPAWLLGLTVYAAATLSSPLCAVPLPATAIEPLIEQLASPEAAVRSRVSLRLLDLGEAALGSLRNAARYHPVAAVRSQATSLAGSIERGEVRAIGDGAGYWLNRVALLPDGRHAVATGGGVIVYDLAEGKQVRRTLELQFARIGLALTRDGRRFVTGHQHDKVVRLGDLRTGAVERTLQGHTDGVHAVALTSDEKRVLTGGLDKTLRLWDADTGQELRQFADVPGAVRSLAISPDGKRALAGHAGSDCSVTVWDVESGKRLEKIGVHTKDVTAVHFLPDGKRFLSAGMDAKVFVIDLETGKELQRISHWGGVYGAALAADGRRALTAGFGDKTVRLWDLTTGKELRAYEGHIGAVLGVAFSPDGARAISSDSRNTIRVWRVP